MVLPPFEYLAPDTLPEALALLDEKNEVVSLLAGGTDILVSMKEGNLNPEVLVSLKHIPELHTIIKDNSVATIGAAVTVSGIEKSGLGGQNPALNDLVQQMATPQIRNRATIGGNLCTAAACADFPPFLLVNNATVELASITGTRIVPLKDFFTGPRQTVRKKNEMLVSISFRQYNRGSAYIKYGIRKAGNIPIVGAACSVSLNNGKIDLLRLAVTAASPVPVLMDETDLKVRGQKPDDSLWEAVTGKIPDALAPISDLRASADFRLHLARVAARRAVEKAHERLTGGRYA